MAGTPSDVPDARVRALETAWCRTPPPLLSGRKACARESTMATIKGTNLDDTLYGTSAADTIYGAGGNDNITGGGGADRIGGGSRFDMVFYSDSSVGVSVNLATGRGLGGTAEA